MIKDLIVNLSLAAKDSGQHDPAGDFAISVADAFGAHILGIAFSYDPVIPGLVTGGIPPEIIESQRRESNSKARAALARFDETARRVGVSAESHMVSASISGAANQLGTMARRFDLAVVGQPGGERAAPEEIIDEGVLFESGRPVIFVPYIQKAALKLDRVMVCWDGGRTAARAVADAMPFLQKAKQVEIVMIGSKEAKSDEAPGVDLGQHLARHDLDISLKRITSPDLDVASTLLSYAADTSADFMVMGGYGHSRLREFILGGATSGILKAMTVPVLMSH